ncbi:hypothetical protein Goklo_004416, partial [Gossypium klotzschianum]|nr:hypothetical protein [Gossypium klotzschianum]
MLLRIWICHLIQTSLGKILGKGFSN